MYLNFIEKGIFAQSGPFTKTLNFQTWTATQCSALEAEISWKVKLHTLQIVSYILMYTHFRAKCGCASPYKVIMTWAVHYLIWSEFWILKLATQTFNYSLYGLAHPHFPRSWPTRLNELCHIRRLLWRNQVRHCLRHY